MGLCYQHWVADSASIRILIHEWFVRQFDPQNATRRMVRFNAGGYFSLFGPHRGARPPAEVLLSSIRWQSQLKIARRIEDRAKFGDFRAKVAVVDVPRDLIEPLWRHRAPDERDP